MKEFKGTPGPWVVDGQSNGARWNVDDSEGYAVAMSFQRPNDKEYVIRDANANLIAAAPDLLGALQYMLKDLNLRARIRGDVDDDGTVVLDIGSGVLMSARAAIARALGETK